MERPKALALSMVEGGSSPHDRVLTAFGRAVRRLDGESEPQLPDRPSKRQFYVLLREHLERRIAGLE